MLKSYPPSTGQQWVQVALSGVALAYVWERAQREILDGQLISCLDEWCAPEDWLAGQRSCGGRLSRQDHYHVSDHRSW